MIVFMADGDAKPELRAWPRTLRIERGKALKKRGI